MFPCSPGVCTQQEAELEALVRGVRLCINVGWPVWRLIGDNSSALEQVASLRAGAGLKHKNRLFYLLQRLVSTVYLEFARGDLNPADCLSTVDSEWKGVAPEAFEGAKVRHLALSAFPGVPSRVWDLGFPKGRQGATCNLEAMALGSADPLV